LLYLRSSGFFKFGKIFLVEDPILDNIFISYCCFNLFISKLVIQKQKQANRLDKNINLFLIIFNKKLVDCIWSLRIYVFLIFKMHVSRKSFERCCRCSSLNYGHFFRNIILFCKTFFKVPYF
jgi:hypothetical protein